MSYWPTVCINLMKCILMYLQSICRIILQLLEWWKKKHCKYCLGNNCWWILPCNLFQIAFSLCFISLSSCVLCNYITPSNVQYVSRGSSMLCQVYLEMHALDWQWLVSWKLCPNVIILVVMSAYYYESYICQCVLYLLYNFVSCGVNAWGKNERENTGYRQMKALQGVGRQRAEEEHNSLFFLYIVHTQNWKVWCT